MAAGDQAPWKKYFADDSIYFDEKGRSMDKAALVNDITSSTQGLLRHKAVKVVNAKSHIEGDTAILSYDLDETETIFGQNMTARYHGTDTWMYRNGKWQIVAGQMLRYYEDPAAGKADTKTYAEYVGTYELAAGSNSDCISRRRRLVCAAYGPRQGAAPARVYRHIFSQRSRRPMSFPARRPGAKWTQ